MRSKSIVDNTGATAHRPRATTNRAGDVSSSMGAGGCAGSARRPRDRSRTADRRSAGDGRGEPFILGQPQRLRDPHLASGADAALRPCAAGRDSAPLSIAIAWVMFADSSRSEPAGRLLALPRTTVGALILTRSLANTSFIGLPMIETYYGAHGLGLGILIDQMGTYLVLSTLGLVVAALYGYGAGITVRSVAKAAVHVWAVHRPRGRGAADPRALPRVVRDAAAAARGDPRSLGPRVRRVSDPVEVAFSGSCVNSAWGCLQARARARGRRNAVRGPARSARRNYPDHDLRGVDGAANWRGDRRSRP